MGSGVRLTVIDFCMLLQSASSVPVRVFSQETMHVSSIIVMRSRYPIIPPTPPFFFSFFFLRNSAKNK